MEHLNKERFLKEVFNYEANKDWKYEGKIPCIIDFYADWCQPCKIVAPILEELSKEYEGKINIYKVNTEEETELAAAFGIRSIPSILFCPKEGQPQMAQGALPKESLNQAINDVLLK
ncbi:MAG: thioredoxin [Lentimicrobiaceae bacterium]|jgi:thioredoxin|nr:thioredoxin [Lentimicrobiaceae bacterium]MDG1901659.1 thioredoxin [Bacteroidales bacterium]MDG2081529.1 thioredoxin [Bacteroidales bacterium]|tara:strand:+ start:1737 stop:2087 length:351 start_codon:yes stop_codon:yes gene_type:complete